MNDHPTSPTITFNHTEREPVTVAVVSAVAQAEGVSPLDLEPLATAIDPDRLNEQVGLLSASANAEPRTVEFEYAGYRVTVTPWIEVSLTDLDQPN